MFGVVVSSVVLMIAAVVPSDVTPVGASVIIVTSDVVSSDDVISDVNCVEDSEVAADVTLEMEEAPILDNYQTGHTRLIRNTKITHFHLNKIVRILIGLV